MKQFIFLTGLIFLGLCVGYTVAAEKGWQLVWSDEFEGSGLPDASKWNYEEGVLRNQELQYYTRERMENARVEDGKLIIETRKEKIDGHHYTSASLITKGKAEWCYGRFEIRAKLPTGKGMWPAIWLLGAGYPEHTRWPECGEIDIMENVGFDPDMIHANIHTKAYNHAIGTNKGDKMTVAAPHADFHIYALEWFEEHMDFFVDNIKYFTFDNEKSGNDVWPFDKPFYLILNAAYGGSWGGAQGVDETILPQRYEIDYVRIYQWK